VNRVVLVSAATCILSACASNSGVVSTGPDTYMVSRQAATGFSGLGTLKADALREANQYCASRQMVAKVTAATESKPPYIVGNFPRAEVQFTCVDGKDATSISP
jgi:hypothetical protein